MNLHNWSNGSFSGMKWENVTTVAWVCRIALILTFFLSKPIRAYQLGEVYARNMGVPIKAFRAALILLSSVLSACVTAFAGPISFVGHRAAAPDEGAFQDGGAAFADPGELPRRGHLLPCV